MSRPFFSICIPNFNYANYVGETIESVLNQTFKDFEVIVVDNASTDQSWEVISNYGSKHLQIRAFRNNYNVGFAPNLQKATEKANGKFIILLSSDDLMYSEVLQVYYDTIQQEGENIVLHAGIDHIGGKGEYLTTKLFHTTQGSTGWQATEYKREAIQPEWVNGEIISAGGIETLQRSLLNGSTPATFLATCYPKALWEKIEGYDLKYIYGPDAMFLYKLLSLDPRFVYVKKRLFGYRVHGSNQASQSVNAGALKQQVDRYVFTFSIEDAILKNAGVERRQLEEVFIQKYCFRESISVIGQGYWLRGFKLFFFAWATYPGIAWRKSQNYICIGLLAAGPLGKHIVKFAKLFK